MEIVVKIKKGLSEKNIEELINYANNDEDVKRFTSDSKRFRDRDSYENWLKKGRSIYSLVDTDDNLLGITWFGAEGDGFTLAIRTYEKARHKGYSYDFLKETMNDFMKNEQYTKALNQSWWLETSVDNIPAITLYGRLGFVMDKREGGGEKVIFRRRPGFVS